MLTLDNEHHRALRKVVDYMLENERRDFASRPKVERQDHIFWYVNKLNIALGGDPFVPLGSTHEHG